MHQLGTEAVGSSAAEFGEYLRAEYDAMAAVVNDLGLAKQ
jgi:hypothetical protein